MNSRTLSLVCCVYLLLIPFGSASLKCATAVAHLHVKADPSFPNRDRNERITKRFQKWAEDMYGLSPDALERQSPEKLASLSKEFEQNMDSLWRIHQEHLIAAYDEMRAARIARLRSSELTIEFKGRKYRALSFKGINDIENQEANVFMVEISENKFALVKQYARKEAMDEQRIAFEKLKAKGKSVAVILESDLQNNALLTSYEEGFTAGDLDRLARVGKISPNIIGLYEFQMDRKYNELIRDTATDIRPVLNTPAGFHPHGNNVLFNPHTGEWKIVDPG